MTNPLKKIVVLYCYFGNWPAYFPVFLQSCKYNPDVDFLFFTDCSFTGFEISENIHFITTSLDEFNALASRKLAMEINLEKPYKVCDLRPAYGVIFEDYMSGYDFWIYSDIDVIYGNIRTFLTNELLSEYDVISARKEYMVGSFSAFRNSEKVNTLFRQSADLKKVFSDDHAYFFDEAGFGCWEIVLHPGKVQTYPSSLDTISHIVKRNAENGYIKAFFKTWVKERLELNTKPWLLQWKQGKLTDNQTQEECLYYHMVGFKDQHDFEITMEKNPEELIISSKGIFTPWDLQKNSKLAPPAEDLEIVIVIPCYNEPDVLNTLNSLFETKRPNSSVEVIIVINSPENADSAVILQNIRSYREINDWISKYEDEKLKFIPLFFPAIPLKYAGVGMARKLGMDEAKNRLYQVANPNGVIVCLDADCAVADNYLTAIESHFKNDPDTPGCAIYFEHPLTEKLEKELADGTSLFELKLRYEVSFGIARNIEPYFHFVGFAMAARAWAYEKVGGMVMLKGGEDLIFMTRIRQLGGFTNLRNTTVYPATRISKRTSKGSASVITYFMNGNISATQDPASNPDMNLSPNPDSLYEFHFNQSLYPFFFDQITEFDPKAFISVPLKIYLVQNQIKFNYDVLREIRLQHPDLYTFSDALNKLLFPMKGQFYYGQHFQIFLNKEYYKPIPLVEAAEKLLPTYGVKNSNIKSPQALLHVFRSIDKTDNSPLTTIANDRILMFAPQKIVQPAKMLEVETAWKGLEMIISDILDRFQIGRENCIEFGVEFGYSSVVFSNFFKKVTGIDTFEGDIHTFHKEEHYQQTKERLSAFKNIELFKADYKDWIAKDESRYNFAHVDIVHTYSDTYRCGLWAAEHSDCTIFHDTESFPDVKQAVSDIACLTGKAFYNFPHFHGLGILVERKADPVTDFLAKYQVSFA